MRFSLNIILFVLSLFTVGIFSSKHHQHHKLVWDVVPKKFHQVSKFKNSISTTTANIIATPSVLEGYAEWITVSWSNISFPSYYDWIGVFNYSYTNPYYLDGPPIEFLYACPKGATTCSSSYMPSYGSIKFRLLNRRTDYIFAYVSGSSEYREVLAVSNVVTFSNLYLPMNVHIAINKNNTNSNSNVNPVQIMWTQKAVKSPKVKYGMSSNSLMYSVDAFYYQTFLPSDLCDQDIAEPAGTDGYFDPGYTISAKIDDLTPDTVYYYIVGDDDYYYSDMVYNFTSPPHIGSYRRDGTIKLITFGDLGNVAIDYAYHHSWDWSNEGELYSINTTHSITNSFLGQPYRTDLLLHIGDISYAVGYESEWDDFLYQIEPIASTIPWMTGIGNHEYSWSGEWSPSAASGVDPEAYDTADSGGECGVPYNVIFPFANINGTNGNPSNVPVREYQPWYSIEYSRIKIIVMSTEHDYTIGSVQNNWIENELKNTDRTIYPWIIFSGHRPMYCNCLWSGDITTGEYLSSNLENLLYKYNISIALWGHQHAYSRSCPIYNNTCMNNGYGTVHLVIGMAGYELTGSTSFPNPPLHTIMYATNKYYGFVYFDFLNDTHVHGRLFDSKNASIILDDFYITNMY